MIRTDADNNVPTRPGDVQASAVTVHGQADVDTYPLQKKRHGFEFLRSIAHLRPRTNAFGAVFRVRSRIAHAVHTYYQERGFLYVHSPIITANDCEGAGEMFRVTTLDPENRTLIQVSMRDAGAADDIFRVLMGDKVEPRREFIEKHALEVRNLDV